MNNAETQQAVGQITSRALNAGLSGTVKVTRWAYAPNGTVTSVDFVVGLREVGTLRYGLPFPEACEKLTDVPACPNNGFESDFNTELLPSGEHLLYVRLRDSNGRTLTLPSPTYVGMPVNIQN